ncbi:hypothetical protein PspLS_07855 [Pyricularia sp. CBS 133598]|nr:hypothetical protein PspLS_07855 [Pyricularia sp. CBS 133598]
MNLGEDEAVPFMQVTLIVSNQSRFRADGPGRYAQAEDSDIMDGVSSGSTDSEMSLPPGLVPVASV